MSRQCSALRVGRHGRRGGGCSSACIMVHMAHMASYGISITAYATGSARSLGALGTTRLATCLQLETPLPMDDSGAGQAQPGATSEQGVMNSKGPCHETLLGLDRPNGRPWRPCTCTTMHGSALHGVLPSGRQWYVVVVTAQCTVWLWERVGRGGGGVAHSLAYIWTPSRRGAVRRAALPFHLQPGWRWQPRGRPAPDGLRVADVARAGRGPFFFPKTR